MRMRQRTFKSIAKIVHWASGQICLGTPPQIAAALAAEFGVALRSTDLFSRVRIGDGRILSKVAIILLTDVCAEWESGVVDRG